ncbi:hypothetical protein FBY35_1717 [Streptomyces sp. SLBN-118]|uniref:hypothetical protein n=1 Tax=Streptomyces sp. SLBN-118 TaxID=2768454 RepID=UPI00114DBE66|nr:hypothetical protein [Streptomyces sp. SLBN-118]TQK51320.1 hypothetical protein FBY35_1717 [Streptomyces sp. SLBN-118]
MTPEHHTPSHAVCLDLRSFDGGPPLERAVADALDEPQQGDARRFVVLDDACDLIAHQLLYEQLYSYGPAQVICLALGPGDDRTLRRPLTLRPPAAGVLWLLDVSAGAGATGNVLRSGTPAADEALRPLVELLVMPDVFDAVLSALGDVVHGVAVPAVRILEHDLTDDARARSWWQALESLVGQEGPAPALGDTLPAELALLLGDSVPRNLENRAWLLPGGPAEARHRECGAALRDSVDGYEQVRGWKGLFTMRAGEADLPGRLERLSFALAGYQETIAGALSDGGGVRLTSEQRSRLVERGIDLPEIPEVSRSSVGPGLRGFTESLIARRMPLRSVAARLAALSDRSSPAGSTARLARLDEICDRSYLAHLTSPVPFAAGGSRRLAAVVAFVLAFAAGLWPGLGWALGPATALAGAALAVLMLRRRPNRSPDGRLDGGGSSGAAPRLFGGLGGGLAGALTGQLLGLPAWACAPALVISLGMVVLLALRHWTAAVDGWWRATDAEFAAQMVGEIDQLLIETAVHDWLFADARYHCSDGARAVSLLLRGLADTAEQHMAGGSPQPAAARQEERGQQPTAGAEPQSASWSWDSWGDSAAEDGWLDATPAAGPSGAPEPAGFPEHTDLFEPARAQEAVQAPAEKDQPSTDLWNAEPVADPAWLERERGDGGPALVDTLVSDLMDGVALIVKPCWGAIERDPSSAGRMPLERRMGELLDEVHTRLRRDGAASPPPYAAHPERRPGAPQLLGVSAERVAWLLGSGGVAEQAVPLCGAEHRRMLSKDPVAVRQVRFVPEAMRRGAEGDETPDSWRVAAEDVVWTATGRHAGVLRLVPLRAETVRTVRGEEGGAP